MMDSSSSLKLPLDIWRATLNFLSVPDQINLSWTSKEILSTIEQTGIFQAHAKRKFPLHLLDVAKYDHSWLKLVQNDNAKNGYYRLQLNHTPMLFGRLTDGFFFRNPSVHKVRSMSWDRLRNEIIMEIEAFGNDLPRIALTECIVRVDHLQIGTPTTPTSTSTSTSFFLPDGTRCPLCLEVAPVRFDEYEHNDNQHQLFRLYFDATLILSDTTYSYKYSFDNERAVSFLSSEDEQHFSSIRELFKYPPKHHKQTQQRGDGGGAGEDAGINNNVDLLDLEARPLEQDDQHIHLPQQQKPGPCEFVSRSSTPAPLEPSSNVLDWEI
jgi:hypothetical protein